MPRLSPEQEEKAKSVLGTLGREEKIIQAYLSGLFNPLKEEERMVEKIEFLDSSAGERISQDSYEGIQKSLSELREVIDLLGLRE